MKFESEPRVSSSEVFTTLRDHVAELLQNEREGRSLPSEMKSSLRRALALLGMTLIMPAAEGLAAPQADDEPAGTSQTEVYQETSFLKEGPKEALVFNKDVKVNDKPITLSASFTYGQSIFVPGISEESVGAQIPVAEHGPFSFSEVSEISHEKSGTAWFMGGEGDCSFPQKGKLEGTKLFITSGRYFDITHSGEADPHHLLQAGIQTDIKKMIPGLSHLPIDGMAYVEVNLAGSREGNGVTIGLKLGK